MSTRYLLLAEGFSGDPLYGKTMRGVLRYRREDVVGILDSTRGGETEDGVPVVGRVEDALPLGPTTALVGAATQGGRFPPEWSEILHACVEHGLDVENGLHVFLADDPAVDRGLYRAITQMHDQRDHRLGLEHAHRGGAVPDDLGDPPRQCFGGLGQPDGDDIVETRVAQRFQ